MRLHFSALLAVLPLVSVAFEFRSPLEFEGTASERIEKALCAAVADGTKRVTIPEKDPLSHDGVWRLERAIVLPDGVSLILESSVLELKEGVCDDVVRNAACDRKCKPDGSFEVLGVEFKKAVLRGGRTGINIKNADGFVVSNLEFQNIAGSAVVVGKTRNGKISNILVAGKRQPSVSPCVLIAQENEAVNVEYITAYAKGEVVKDESQKAKISEVVNLMDAAVIGDRPIPALVPAPRSIRRIPGAYRAPSPYVTRDWIDFERDPSMKAESYSISVSTAGVKVIAADRRGELHAMATLRQLGEEKTPYRNCDFYTGGDIGRPLVLPCCEIEDFPEYPWRGMLVDEGRHFFGKETIKHVLRRMSDHKYNILHWHLTEDQGWRIAIDAYPDLVKYGAVRPDSPVHHARGDEMSGEKYGPFYYTKDEIREIVVFAAERGIEIVPEIEFPGHIRAALAAYPEFSCIGESLERRVRCTWGVEKDVLCVGNEEAMKFVERVLDEVVELFPGRFVHIGGDECPTMRWQRCPKCRDKAKALGIKPEKLQGYVTARFAAYLEGKGKRVVGWDEIIDCDIPKTALVMSWRGRKGGIAAAKEGRSFVMCPSSHCYFNRTDGNPDDPFTPRNAHQVVSLEKVYFFDPSAGVGEDEKRNLLGSQACFWSEVIWNRYDLDWRMWPRSCALAEVLWTGRAKKDFGEFVERLQQHRRRLVMQGVNAAPIYCENTNIKIGGAKK